MAAVGVSGGGRRPEGLSCAVRGETLCATANGSRRVVCRPGVRLAGNIATTVPRTPPSPLTRP